jgi:DNA invertase Pin-like site-specific DNA recombinase
VSQELPENMSEPKLLCWAAYIRVSPATQAEHETLEAQREAISAWAKRNGSTIRWYGGIDGRAERHRERQLLRLLSDLDKHNLVGIVVSAFDRLGRDAIDLMLLSRDLKARGKELVSLGEGDRQLAAALDASAQLTRDVWDVFAKFNHALHHKEMREGYARYLASGGKVGRKPIKIDWKTVDPLIEAGVSASAISRLVGINENTARLHVRRRKAELAALRKPENVPTAPATLHPVPWPDNAHRRLEPGKQGKARRKRISTTRRPPRHPMPHAGHNPTSAPTRRILRTLSLLACIT